MANRIPDKFVSSPAAWLGPQQSKRSDWIHVLSDAENAELDSAIQAYRRMGKALREISASDYPLPVLGPAIAAWMRELDDGRGFFLVRGFRRRITLKRKHHSRTGSSVCKWGARFPKIARAMRWAMCAMMEPTQRNPESGYIARG